MEIHLTPELETALNIAAGQLGLPPEDVALDALKQRFLPATELQPRDEWERGLLAAARDCGVSLSNAALSSEAIYD